MSSLSTVLNDLYRSVIETSTTNVILITIAAVLVYRLIRGDGSNDDNDEPPKLPPPLPKHDMTMEELVKYDGKGSDKRVCLAIKGVVYDVSKSPNYRPGGSYASFAGRDVTLALATWDVTKVTDKWQEYDLDAGQLSNANEWIAQFDEKYDVVGKLVKELPSQDDTQAHNDNDVQADNE